MEQFNNKTTPIYGSVQASDQRRECSSQEDSSESVEKVVFASPSAQADEKMIPPPCLPRRAVGINWILRLRRGISVRGG